MGADWCASDSVMGALVRATNWSATSLGGLHTWSPSIRAVVNLCLASRLPMVLALGPEQRILYNDAFRPYVGGANGRLTVGEPAPAALGALWDTLGPMHHEAAAGRAASVEHVRLDETASVTINSSPIVAADGRTIEGVFSAIVETQDASRLREVERLRDSEQVLRASVDLIGLGRYRSDPEKQSIEWDARLKAIWGLEPTAPVDFGVFLSGIHPDDRERVQAALGASIDPTGDGVCDIEYRVVGLSGGPERWVMTRGKTVFENGETVRFHGVVLDISERKRAEQTNLVLIAELEHRTRNLLAVVSALAEQTITSCETLNEFVGPFRERLATLSRVQGLLSRGETSPVMIGELVELELRALGAEPDGKRVMVRGPDVALPNRSVQILALSLHELATNARKHGALRTPNGRLVVSWQVTAEQHLRRLALDWHETGITWHTPAPSSRVGLGRTLIEKSLPYQLDAQTRLEIGPEDVRCAVSMALD